MKKRSVAVSFLSALFVLSGSLWWIGCKSMSDENAHIEALLSKLTLEEKIAMIHANTMFSSGGVERLGIPALTYTDGPHGVRWESVPNGWESTEWKNDACTYLPALSALSATWNRDLARRYGEVLGAECKARGKHVSLAPGVNITRSVLNGRTWEYFGEDPFLTAELAVSYIQGVQSKGVASCVKHFALNSQAYHQYTISSEVDDRAFYEIYMPAFEAAVKRAGVMAVMPAYNKVRGHWCTENTWLIDTVLRQEFGFDGVVVSDWNAVHSTERAALCGTDVEMGTAKKRDGKYDFDSYYFAKPLLEKVRNGDIPEDCIDRKVRNILRLMLRLDLIGKAPYDTTGMAAKLAVPQHTAIAREVAEESFVLLKNRDGKLPLDARRYRKIAVVGANAATLFAKGGGSTKLKAKYEISALEGLKSYLGSGCTVTYAPGYEILDRKYVAAMHRFTDEFDVSSDDLVRDAVKKASEADLVIYVGGLTHEHGMDCEGYDRPDMKLPYKQDELIGKIMEANPNTVVVLMAGSPIEMGAWYEETDALLQCSFLGMEGGHALARVLFGDVNPSGKLTNTWAVRLEEMPDHVFGEYPGADEKVRFNEGVMVGYRYFDTYGVTPQFEFGYGLSYTTFDYSDLVIAPVWAAGEQEFDVSFTITNTGGRYGQETAQVYVRQHQCSVERPQKELKGFEKVALQPGESKRIHVKLPLRALQYYDTTSKSWKDDAGKFSIFVGASSRDIRLSGEFVRKH